ncbi:unnamed protein product [Malus baccata var. baccata]
MTRCPRRTIPIRRSTVDDVLRAKSMVDFGKKQHCTLNITANLASIRIDAPDVVNGNGHETHVRTEGVVNVLHLTEPRVVVKREATITKVQALDLGAVVHSQCHLFGGVQRNVKSSSDNVVVCWRSLDSLVFLCISHRFVVSFSLVYNVKTKYDISKKKDIEGMIEILLLPFAVTVAALHVDDEKVEGDRVVVMECRIKGEVGSELEAIVAKKPLIHLIVKFENICVYLSEILNILESFYKK